MAGICALCNGLERKAFIVNDEVYSEACRCKVGQYDKDGIEGYYTQKQVLKPCKSVADIQEKCDKWDDRLKGKDNQ